MHSEVKTARQLKGQGAMEYLMTYGWVIMVLMVVGLVLWQMGIFGMDQSMVTFTGFTKIKPQIAGTGLTTDGIFTAVFTNTVGTKISIKGVRVTDLNANATLCCSHDQQMPLDCQSPQSDAAADIGGEDYNHFNSGGVVEVPAGENVKVQLGGSGASGPVPNNCLIAGAVSGRPYNIKVDLYYDMRIGGSIVTQVDTGRISGPFE